MHGKSRPQREHAARSFDYTHQSCGPMRVPCAGGYRTSYRMRKGRLAADPCDHGVRAVQNGRPAARSLPTHVTWEVVRAVGIGPAFAHVTIRLAMSRVQVNGKLGGVNWGLHGDTR